MKSFFDSIEFDPLFTALENQAVDPAQITMLRDLYSGATSTLKLHRDGKKIKLERGARQGGNLSPKLFTACLQDAIIGRTSWKERRVNVDGERLSHLIFANDIVLMLHSQQELNDMLNDIHLMIRSEPVGFNMHLGKTKVMLNQYTSSAPIIVDGTRTTIEEVESYIYLGTVVTKDGDLLPEAKEKDSTGMGSFWKGEQHHEKPQSK